MAKQDVREFIGLLFASRDAAHKAHLSSNSYAQHVALGEFYKKVIELADEFAEAWQGRKLELIGDIPTFTPATGKDVAKTLQQHLKVLEEAREEVTGGDTALQNIMDSVIACYLSTIYKLTFLK